MSKKDFNPYRDLLDIPSLTDENPTDYQLLGIEDFEGDSERIAAAHEKRMQQIADLYQLVTEMSGKIDAARDRISDSKAKEEYDNNLRITGRAGVPQLGTGGGLAILGSFILSIIIVVIATFYIYPMIVPVQVENVGDSVATLPNYLESQSKKELDVIKEQQNDITTMDVNINLPIDVDGDSTVEFIDLPAADADLSNKKASVEGMEDPDFSLPEDAPTIDQPAVSEPEDAALPEDAPAIDQPAAAEEPALPEDAPAIDQPAVPEDAALPEDVPAIDQPAAAEEVPLATRNSQLATPDAPAIDEPAAAEEVPLAAPNSADAVVPESPSVNQTAPDAPEPPELPSVPEIENAPVELPEVEKSPVEAPSADRVGSQVDVDSAADRVGSQVDVDSAETGSFGGITSSTRPRGSAPGSFGGITSSTRPRGSAPDASAIYNSTQPDSPTVNAPAFSDAHPDLDTPTIPKMSDLGNTGIPELPPMDEELTASQPPTAPQPPVIPELAADSDVTRGTGITRHQTTLDNADNVRSPETLPAENNVQNDFSRTMSATQNVRATETIADRVGSQVDVGSAADRVGSQVDVDSAETGSFGGITSSTRPRGSAPGSFGGITSSTRPRGFALEDVDILDQFVQMGQKARTDVEFSQLLSSARQVEADLVKKKDFQKAQQIADVVYASCARSADKAYRSEAYRYKEFISKRSAWWESVCTAESKMETDGAVSPTDAALVARWKIEIENDWETGLKFLAYSDNEQIQLAVKRDIAANPENVRHCLVVANDWWNLSQDPVPMQKQYRQRASMWYSKALPSISDKQIRTLIEKRISIAEQGFSKSF